MSCYFYVVIGGYAPGSQETIPFKGQDITTDGLRIGPAPQVTGPFFVALWILLFVGSAILQPTVPYGPPLQPPGAINQGRQHKEQGPQQSEDGYPTPLEKD